jgi:predicted component of type VI protein secretion system
MFDTHAIARTLTEANFTPDQADALTDAIRQAAEQGDHVTADQFRAGLAEVRTEIANLDTRLSTQIAKLHAEQQAGIANLEPRLVRWMVGTVFATAGVTFAILRFLAE